MRILIAPDKFKGSLSAKEVAIAIQDGLQKANTGKPKALEITMQPIGDGGEGTMNAICEGNSHCESQLAKLHDARGRLIEVLFFICYFDEKQEAYLEMASASGLAMLSPAERDPEHSTSYGTGELIFHAHAAGAREIYVGLGGSATIDAGAGMLQALGFEFYTDSGTMDLQEAVTSGELNLAEALESIRKIRISQAARDLQRLTQLHIVADVQSPLHGPFGAIEQFGAQKGLVRESFPRYRKALEHFARVCETSLNFSTGSLSNQAGSGAAGGLGFALLLLNARIHPGFEFFAQKTGLENILNVDLVITGEGKMDATSLAGKGPGALARMCADRGIPCIAVCGKLENERELKESGLFKEILEISSGLDERESMAKADSLISAAIVQFMEFGLK